MKKLFLAGIGSISSLVSCICFAGTDSTAVNTATNVANVTIGSGPVLIDEGIVRIAPNVAQKTFNTNKICPANSTPYVRTQYLPTRPYTQQDPETGAGSCVNFVYDPNNGTNYVVGYMATRRYAVNTQATATTISTSEKTPVIGSDYAQLYASSSTSVYNSTASKGFLNDTRRASVQPTITSSTTVTGSNLSPMWQPSYDASVTWELYCYPVGANPAGITRSLYLWNGNVYPNAYIYNSSCTAGQGVF